MKTKLSHDRINRTLNTGYNNLFELNQDTIDNSINRMKSYGLLNNNSIDNQRR